MRWTIAANPVRSLTWIGEELADLLVGRRYQLDGHVVKGCSSGGRPFDAALASPSGKTTAVYVRYGTKAVLRVDGKVREVNRSYYHATVTDYPIALIRLPDGREAIAHCPDAYNRLEIDDLATGERLTSSPDRQLKDVFHSCLEASPDGRLLLSTGWVWQPHPVARIYDVAEALRRPESLDDGNLGPDMYDYEIHDSAWLDSRFVAFSLLRDDPTGLGAGDPEVSVFDVEERRFRSTAPVRDMLGPLMGLGTSQVVAFRGHPKVVDLATGQIVEEWPDLPITRDATPFALDPSHRRFAVAGDDGIVVIQL